MHDHACKCGGEKQKKKLNLTVAISTEKTFLSEQEELEQY